MSAKNNTSDSDSEAHSQDRKNVNTAERKKHRRSRVFTPNAPPTDVRRVIHPPTFWPEKPAVWFLQLEGQFNLAGINDDATKYFYVVSYLDSKYANLVEDVLTSPPKTDMYERLKAELIKRLSVSKENQLKQLLMHEELGDRKPSQFLRHLRQLAGTDIPDNFLKTIWTSRLPNNIQVIIACQDTAPLQSLADMADKIHDIMPSSPQVAAASSSRAESVLDGMARQIAELTKQVQALTQHASRSRTRSSRTQRSRSASTRSQSNYRKFPMCWYHAKHGSNARKCVKPCDYQAGNDTGSR